VCYRTGHCCGMSITKRSTVQGIIVKFSIHLHLNSSTVSHVGTHIHFQHISATTKRSSKKLNPGLMQKVMLTEIQVFRDVMLCRRVVTDVSKHRSTDSFRAKQWNNPNLRLIHPGDEPNTVSTCQSPEVSNIAPNLLAVFASQSSANQQTLFAPHTRTFDAHSDLSFANLNCIFLMSKTVHASSGHTVRICAWQAYNKFPCLQSVGEICTSR